MTQPVSPLTGGQRRHANAFDALRMIAASAVLFSHAFVLYGFVEPNVLRGESLGTLAVHVFFVISGYLIAQSWEADPDLRRFFIRRGLRIMPGLIVVVLLTVLLLGPVVSTLSPAEYFGAELTWQYLLSNVSLIVGVAALPGVFLDNPYPHAVNNSLWTLFYEVLMYSLLALIGWALARFGAVARRRLALAVFCAAALGSFALNVLGVTVWKFQPPVFWRIGLQLDVVSLFALTAYFFAGTVLNAYRDRIDPKPVPALCALAVLAALSIFGPVSATALLAMLVLPYALIAAAWHLPRAFQALHGRDYSYGIYVYAFPVQQTFSMLGTANGWSFGAVVLLSCVFTLALAMLSWYWVEKPALALKSRFTRRPASELKAVAAPAGSGAS